MKYIILMVLALSMGCTRYVSGDKMELDIKVGPPCKITLVVDGEVIQVATSKNPCSLNDLRTN